MKYKDVIWKWKDGRPIPIKKTNAYMNSKIRKRKKTKAKISKQDYATLASIINTYPNKFKKGLNSQIIDDKVYIFIYNDYDDFEIVKRKKYKEK